MKIKTSELSDAALNWAVSVAGEYEANGHRPRLGWSTRTDVPRYWCVRHQVKDVGWFADYEFCPTRDWSQGGPIIDREGISLRPIRKPGHKLDGQCLAAIDHGNTGTLVQWVKRETFSRHYWKGPTPLIAAMRCYVASRLGDEVEVPEELL